MTINLQWLGCGLLKCQHCFDQGVEWRRYGSDEAVSREGAIATFVSCSRMSRRSVTQQGLQVPLHSRKLLRTNPEHHFIDSDYMIHEHRIVQYWNG